MEASCPMVIRFETLGTPAQMERVMESRRMAQHFWAQVLDRGLPVARAILEKQALPLEVVRDALGTYFVIPEERSLTPLAQLWCDEAPSGVLVRLGRAPSSYDEALARALQVDGVDLSTSRVRAGFTRGHLLEVVISVPFDISGDDESLQVAAEVFLEHLIGDQALDLWVANVSVTRIARTRGLLVVSDQRDAADSHALREFGIMLERATTGVLAQLPESRLVSLEGAKQWTALEIPEAEGGLLPDRRYASTCLPEALKAALEGLPFASPRFTKGPELLCYIAWEGKADTVSRLRLREQVEECVSTQPGAALCGTGFGLKRDFVDLWILPDEENLRSLGARVGELAGSCELGFYDESLRRELLQF